MKEANDPELKRLREVAVALLGPEKGGQLANLVGEVSGRAGNGTALGEMPAWAKGYVDRRHLLRWDSSQYIGHLGVNGVLISCIVDTGAHRTIIDREMARALGLKVRTEDI